MQTPSSFAQLSPPFAAPAGRTGGIRPGAAIHASAGEGSVSGRSGGRAGFRTFGGTRDAAFPWIGGGSPQGAGGRNVPARRAMIREDVSQARILIVDDDRANVELVEHILRPEGYAHLVGTTDPRAALDLCAEAPPDLLLLDLLMPGIDGFQVLDRLRSDLPTFEHLPVLVLTSDDSREAKERALSGGAKDFLTKPLSAFELRLRVRNLLHTRFLQLALRDQNGRLEERVRERTRELREAQNEIIERLALAAEYHDDETGRHTRRVGQESARLAKALGWPADRVELMRRAAPLHDVGKIAVDHSILLKAGRLSTAEFERIKTHVAVGHAILSGSRFPLLQMAAEIALYHHEHWDGRGYQFGLRGEAIPLSARIVAVVDVFDSLTHKRPYKGAWSRERALAEIEREAGRKFDPEVAREFLRLHGRKPAPPRTDGQDDEDAPDSAAAEADGERKAASRRAAV